MDVDAGSIVEGEKTVETVGDEILRFAVKVASGARTCAEKNKMAES